MRFYRRIPGGLGFHEGQDKGTESQRKVQNMREWLGVCGFSWWVTDKGRAEMSSGFEGTGGGL